MPKRTTRTDQTHAEATNADLGLRHVSWVRVVLTPSGPQCAVAGIGHRLPTIRRVPLAAATALAAQGVPTVVRRGSSVSSAG